MGREIHVGEWMMGRRKLGDGGEGWEGDKVVRKNVHVTTEFPC